MLKHKRDTFIAEFVRIEHIKKSNKQILKENTFTYIRNNVVLKKVHLASDGSFFCPYARFRLGRGFSKLGKMSPGSKIKFNARYTEYRPGHFELSHSTKIEYAYPKIPQWKKAYKEIKNYNMSKVRLKSNNLT